MKGAERVTNASSSKHGNCVAGTVVNIEVDTVSRYVYWAMMRKREIFSREVCVTSCALPNSRSKYGFWDVVDC